MPKPSNNQALHCLEANKLCKSLGGRRVVDAVSFALRPQEILGLLGPNGAGKTTCFYMIMGLIAPDSGSVMLNGTAITPLPIYERARAGLGYLPQEASIFRALNVADNIMAILELQPLTAAERSEKLDALIQEFALDGVRKTLGRNLSGGERRRVEIARCLAAEPSYILLDEPFAGIDPIAIDDIRALIQRLKQRGIGILITDHNVRETLGLCDRALLLHNGAVLLSGKPKDILANTAARKLYLGEKFSL